MFVINSIFIIGIGIYSAFTEAKEEHKKAEKPTLGQKSKFQKRLEEMAKEKGITKLN